MADKHKLCPCPKTASAAVRALFTDIVERTPPGIFSRADQAALLSYCQLTVQLSKLSRRPNLNDDGTRRATRLAHAIRSIGVRLGLKQLQWEAARAEDVVVAVQASEIMAKIASDPNHPRHGLMGCRVRGIE